MHFKWLSGKPGNDEEKEDTQTRNLRACLATAVLHNGKGSLLVLALRHLDAGAQRHGCHDFWLQFWPSSGPTAAAQQWTWTQFLHIFSHMKALESAKDANFPSPVSNSNPPLSTFPFFLSPRCQMDPASHYGPKHWERGCFRLSCAARKMHTGFWRPGG